MFCIRRNASRATIWMPSSLKSMTQHRLFTAHSRRCFSDPAPRHSTGGTFLKPEAKPAHPAPPRERRGISPLSRLPNHPSAARCRGYVSESVGNACKFASARSLPIAGGHSCQRRSLSGHCSSCNIVAGSGSHKITPDSRWYQGDIITKAVNVFIHCSARRAW